MAGRWSSEKDRRMLLSPITANMKVKTYGIFGRHTHITNTSTLSRLVYSLLYFLLNTYLTYTNLAKQKIVGLLLFSYLPITISTLVLHGIQGLFQKA